MNKLLVSLAVAFAIPVQRAAAQCEEFRMSLPTPAATSVLGWSVAIEGDLAVVGSIGTDDGCPMDPNCNSGSALVYRRTSGTWNLEATLTASDASAGDQFGQNCSISGDTIMIGAHFDGPGSAYVFEFDGTNWIEAQKLTGSDSLDTFHFGHCVSLDGDTALIGVMRDNFAGTETGAAFIFERVGGVWTESVKLTASDFAAGDRFGRSCDLKNGVAIIGAHLHDGAQPDEGAAYVYERDDAGTPGDPLDDTWPEVNRLVSSQPVANGLFGRSVAVEGTTAIVGAAKETAAAVNSGAVHVFERGGSGVWTLQQILGAFDGEDGDSFGTSVAIDGDRVVVGAPGDDDEAADSGAAYQLERGSLGFVVTSKFTASGITPGATLGNEMTVDVSGTTALFGAPFSSVDAQLGGGAYLVDLTGCLGDSYCVPNPNSTGSIGAAELTGSALIEANDLTFTVSSLPQSAFGYLLASRTPGIVTLPGGSLGNLCVVGMVGRYINSIFNTGTTGSASTTIDLTAVPSSVGPFAAVPGLPLYFQVWHRDAVGGQATSNFSDALEIILR